MTEAEGTREKSQQPGGGGDLSAYKQETGGTKERVKRSNSREGGGDLRVIIWRIYLKYVR